MNYGFIMTALIGVVVIALRHTKGNFLFVLFLLMLAASSGLWALSEKESVVKACMIATKKAS